MATYTYIDSGTTDFVATFHSSSSTPTATQALGSLWSPGDLAFGFLAVDHTGTCDQTVTDGGTGWTSLGQADGTAVFGAADQPLVKVFAKFLQVGNADPVFSSHCSTGLVARPFCGVLIYQGPRLFSAVSLGTAGTVDSGERHPASASTQNVTKTLVTNTVGAADTLLVRFYMTLGGGGSFSTFAADASEHQRLTHHRDWLSLAAADELHSSASDYAARTEVATPSFSDTIAYMACELVPDVDQIITGGTSGGDAWGWKG